MPRCAVRPCEKNRGVAGDTCDGVAPRDSIESRPMVTVLITWLPRRSKQELGRALVRLAEIHRLTWRGPMA